MDNQAKATARPWSIKYSVIAKQQTEYANPLISDGKNTIARVSCSSGGFGKDEAQDNASLIVKAVNNHEALLEACREALEICTRIKPKTGELKSILDDLTNNLTDTINQASK